MASGTTLTTFAALMKTLYPKDRVQKLIYEDHPLFAMIPKFEKFVGDQMKVPLIYGNSLARNTVFSAAQTASGTAASKSAAFFITRVKDYQVFSIDNETIEATQSDVGAFAEAIDQEQGAALSNFSKAIATFTWGDGSGAIGQSATAAAAVITLVNINDVTNFEVGQVIVAAATKSGALRAGSATVINVDRDLGVITFGAAFAALAINDYLFMSGDAQNGGGSPLKMAGVQAWVPTTAPGATPFFGVVRNVDVTRLGGQRFAGTTLNYEEAFMAGLARLKREGGKATAGFVNPFDWKGIAVALSGKVEMGYSQMLDFGFESIKVRGPSGTVPIYADTDLTSGLAYMLQMNTWKLNSLNQAPHLLDRDGMPLLRQPTDDGYEGRYAMYGNVGCSAPGFNMVISLPT